MELLWCCHILFYGGHLFGNQFLFSDCLFYLFQDVYAVTEMRLHNHMRDLCVRWSFWFTFYGKPCATIHLAGDCFPADCRVVGLCFVKVLFIWFFRPLGSSEPYTIWRLLANTYQRVPLQLHDQFQHNRDDVAQK